MIALLRLCRGLVTALIVAFAAVSFFPKMAAELLVPAQKFLTNEIDRRRR